jgi:flagellar export protein FliJ
VKKFAFKLDPLLKLRRNHRDLCRQLLADVLRHDDDLVSRRSEATARRVLQIDELRRLTSAAAGVDIDASVARRAYAGHLSGDIGRIDNERAEIARQIDLCRQALVRADQAVKSLEKLAEKERAEFIYLNERREEREREETWRAIRVGEALSQ